MEIIKEENGDFMVVSDTPITMWVLNQAAIHIWGEYGPNVQSWRIQSGAYRTAHFICPDPEYLDHDTLI